MRASAGRHVGRSAVRGSTAISSGLKGSASALRTTVWVNSPGEWKAAILELAADPELRRRVGLEAARTVVERFSVRANRDVYLKVLDGVFRREKGSDREGEA